MRLIPSSNPPVRLETERFVLKSLTRRELAHISYPWTNDPKVMEPLNRELRMDVTNLQQIIAQQSRQVHLWHRGAHARRDYRV
jgi:hypothetical protein